MDRLPVERRWSSGSPAVPGREDRLTHLEVLPARDGRVDADWPAWVPDDVRAAFAARGVTRPVAAPGDAAERPTPASTSWSSTGTASGKSLAYQLPALTAIRAARGPARAARRRPSSTSRPTKALAQDQLAGAARRWASTCGSPPTTATARREERDWARDHGEYVLTNPDMLHRSLLPGHARWARFLGSLRYVVVDECHHYRGVFGAHVAQVLRRLRRVCALYGAHPTFVLASATVAEPRGRRRPADRPRRGRR